MNGSRTILHRHGNAWFRCLLPRPEARLRLFCFPYAGGGSLVFNHWYKELTAAVEVWSLQLPGREQRISEPPLDRLEPLLDTISHILKEVTDKPFAFFGHSLGAIVCFELARELYRQNRPLPRYLFVSGCRAPHLPDPHPPIHQLPLGEFIEELRQYNGTPALLLENDELMALFGPVLQADFAIFETYRHLPGEPLPCPISAFGGYADNKVDVAAIPPWREQTSAEFTLRMLPGDHFFLHQQRHNLLAAISDDLRRLWTD
jgi:medium-chain acyl-[acyl-carrier-protein] hydrolase